MDRFGVIYKITNKINGKVYIGKTKNSIKARWASHVHAAKRPDTKIGRAIAKYGKDSFTVEEICTCIDLESLNKSEIHLIEFFKSTENPIGYNIAIGGDKPCNSPDIGKRISKATTGRTAHNKGKRMSEEQRLNLSNICKGRPSAFKGKKHSNKSRYLQSIAAKKRFSQPSNHPLFGKKMSAEVKDKISKSTHKKSIIAINVEDGHVIRFESMRDAQRNGFFCSGILANIKGRIKSSYKGYVWKYG